MSNFLLGSCFSHQVTCPNLLREAIAPHTYREAALHLPHLGIFRMLKYKLSVALLAVVLFGVCAESCEAGPLLDWLRGVPPTRAYRYNAYYPTAQAPAGIAGAPANQLPGTCTSMCPTTRYQTVNRVVANYVPFTAYRSEWYRVPTTYYRPSTTTNPQTGCITTCMKPCTTYQMQARRVPYTTYRTVYRTVQHRVPYTVYETSYSTTGSCSSCGTGSPVSAPFQSQSQYYGSPSPSQNYGLNPSASYSTPANTVPQLNPSEIRPDPEFQRRLVYPPQPEADPAASKTGVDAVNSSNTNPVNVSPPAINMPANPAPVVDQSVGNQTASLIRGKWGYSPVRHAGYLRSSTANRFSNAGSRSAVISKPTASRNQSSRSAAPFRAPKEQSSWTSIQD